MLKQRYREASAVAVIVGIVLVLVAELGHVEWTKFFGAVLIALGGTGLGIWAGLHPQAWTTPRRLYPWRATLGSVVAVLLALPLLLALASGLVGIGGGTASLLGGGLTLLLAALTIVSLVLSLRAIRGAAHSSLPGDGDAPSLGQTT